MVKNLFTGSYKPHAVIAAPFSILAIQPYAMSFLKKIFGTKDRPVRSYGDFWDWFRKNEKDFHKVVKQGGDVETEFFNKLQPRLRDMREGYWYLTGMCDENTVELVFTADGVVKNFVFIEELVQAAPAIPGWKFTAFKPALGAGSSIEMDGINFGSDNTWFYANEVAEYPDEIDITIVHENFSAATKDTVTNGVYIQLDNMLGELNFATSIDILSVVSKDEAKKELIPIDKLEDFLVWRQKEFVEKYQGTRYDTENDKYISLEAQLQNGNYIVCIMDEDLLHWDSKASHPWIAVVTIKYDGSSSNGMPTQKIMSQMEQMESEILSELKDADGYLNIGRETGNNERQVFFACKEFRKPSKVLDAVQRKYPGTDMTFDIYKDKYWQSFDRFVNA